MNSAVEEVVFDDNLVKNIRLRWGLEERPLWDALNALPPSAQIKWIDRLSSYESLACEWSLARAYERALKIKPPQRAEAIRSLLSELQRLLWCFHYLAKIFKSIKDVTRYQQALRLCEYGHQGQEIFSGSRVLPQILCLGGVERDFSVGDVRKFRELLKSIEYEQRLFFRGLMDDHLFHLRLRGLHPIKKETLALLNWYGPVGQASGLTADLRIAPGYSVYSSIKLQSYEADLHCDALERVKSVLFQAKQSVNLCYRLLVGLPEGEYRIDVEEFDRSEIMSIGMCEGASGPVFALLEPNSTIVVTTSMRVASAVENILHGLHYEDLDVGLASLAFSFEEADLRC